MSELAPPSSCPACHRGIVRRISGWWCPRCQRYLVQRVVPVYSPHGEPPVVRLWGLDTRL